MIRISNGDIPNKSVRYRTLLYNHNTHTRHCGPRHGIQVKAMTVT